MARIFFVEKDKAPTEVKFVYEQLEQFPIGCTGCDLVKLTGWLTVIP